MAIAFCAIEHTRRALCLALAGTRKANNRFDPKTRVYPFSARYKRSNFLSCAMSSVVERFTRSLVTQIHQSPTVPNEFYALLCTHTDALLTNGARRHRNEFGRGAIRTLEGEHESRNFHLAAS